MTMTTMIDKLTDAGGTIDRLYTVGLVIECVMVREEAYHGDEGLYRGLISVADMVRGIRVDVQEVADMLCERADVPDEPLGPQNEGRGAFDLNDEARRAPGDGGAVDARYLAPDPLEVHGDGVDAAVLPHPEVDSDGEPIVLADGHDSLLST